MPPCSESPASRTSDCASPQRAPARPPPCQRHHQKAPTAISPPSCWNSRSNRGTVSSTRGLRRSQDPAPPRLNSRPSFAVSTIASSENRQTTDALGAFSALRDYELCSPVAGELRRRTPLFTRAHGGDAFRHSVVDLHLKSLLSSCVGANEAKEFSLRSHRVQKLRACDEDWATTQPSCAGARSRVLRFTPGSRPRVTP